MALTDRLPYLPSVDRPPLRLPGGARVAVWVIVNVEVWQIGRAMPRTVLPPPMGEPLLPDVPNWSWHEYGMRAGFWRQHQALVKRGIRGTLALNGMVTEAYPQAVAAALAADWEFMGHGDVQRPMHSLADQAGDIARALDRIERATGRRPRSWESPGLTETEATLDLLRAEGIEFVADWVIDDLPQAIATPHGPIYTIPYTVETNDITVFALQHHPAEEFFRRGRDQFDRLYQEGAQNARVMAISVHPYITGVPHRIGALERLLDHIAGHEHVAFMTASEIGDWYKAEDLRASSE